MKDLSCLPGLPLTDLCLFWFQYGRNALEIVMKSIVKLDSPLVSPPSEFKGDFFKGLAFIALNNLLLISVFSLWLSNGGGFFSPAEIQSGLIGVGLINVEDTSGIVTLDKGTFFVLNILLIAADNMHVITLKLSDTCLQTTTTSGSSWTAFWAWRSISRMLCSSIFPTRWQQLYKKQRGTADTTWAFWVRRCFLSALMLNHCFRC